MQKEDKTYGQKHAFERKRFTCVIFHVIHVVKINYNGTFTIGDSFHHSAVIERCSIWENEAESITILNKYLIHKSHTNVVIINLVS